jgi:hypothetical protein
MTIRAQRTRSRQPEPDTGWDRDMARTLALLEDSPDAAVTISDMRERGIHAPAQVIYALRLAGYDIDRGPIRRNPSGPLGYRLRTGNPPIDGRATAPHPSSDEP